MSAQRLNIQSNAYTCQAFVYSHLQQPAVRLGGGRAYISLALSLLRCKITRARTLHQHPLYLYFGPGRGQYARFLSRAPAHHRGQRCLPLLFFLSPSLSTRAANHHPGHARPRALGAAGDTGDLACRGGGALLQGPQQQADGVEDSSYLASVEVKQQKQTAVVCTWGA